MNPATGTFSSTSNVLAPGASAFITLKVRADSTGDLVDTTSTVTSDQASPGTAASATLDVNPDAAPTLAIAFGAPSINLGDSTNLTFTVTNPNTTVALTNINFSDALPAGLVVATPNDESNSLGGTATAVAGSSTVTLSGSLLAAGTSGTLIINVTGIALGEQDDMTGIISSDQATGTTASASLTVLDVPLTVTTTANPAVGNFTATLGGDVTSNGDSPLLARGIVYAKTATNPSPTLTGTGVTVIDDPAQTIGIFADMVNALAAGTGYSFVAFATNATGTAYGSVSTFTTTHTPGAAISGVTNAVPGQTIPFTLLASDPLGVAQTSRFAFHITWGDGTGTVASVLSGATTNHTYANPGTYVIQISATDVYGNTLPFGTLTVVVSRASVGRAHFGQRFWHGRQRHHRFDDAQTRLRRCFRKRRRPGNLHTHGAHRYREQRRYGHTPRPQCRLCEHLDALWTQLRHTDEHGLAGHGIF